MKTSILIIGAVLLLLVGGSLWSRNFALRDPNMIARGSLHWHPQLTIYVKGNKVGIPVNVGIGGQFAGTRGFDPQMNMAAVHTHEDVPIIHLEFMAGPVYVQDVMLGQFFEIWGKDMRSFGPNMHMTVNGKENFEYEKYIMHDGDKIVLNYD